MKKSIPAVLLFLTGMFLLGSCSKPTPTLIKATKIEQVTSTIPPGDDQPRAAIDPTIAIVGPLEVVYDWSTEHCDPQDFPDMPIRPFRDAEGNVQVNRSWFNNRRFLGSDLNSIEPLCDYTYQSLFDPDPAHFSARQWFQAFYTEDGQTVYAIIHNEHNSQDFGDEFANYWSITWAVSTDGGATFQQPDPPENFIGSSPYPYEPGAGFYGLITGSNIIKGKDHYYYMLAIHQVYKKNEQRICLLRTGDLSDPSSWRAWDGSGFNMSFVNPYQEAGFNPAEHECPAVDDNLLELGNIGESLQYNTFLEQYVVVSLGVNWIDGNIFWGANYSTSPDLIHWEKKKPLLELLLGAHAGPGGPDAAGYLILLDPDSETRNFETVDKTGYIYFTRHNYTSGIAFQDNDLVRFPVEFFLSEQEAKQADVRTELDLDKVINGESVTLSGDLRDYSGDPIDGALVEFTSSPDDDNGALHEYTVTATVPQNATGAFAGFRVNTECNCSGESDFYIYDFNYSENGGGNRVVNPKFANNLNNYYYNGSAGIDIEPSDLNDGRMAHITADSDQSLLFFSDRFYVTPGATFTYTVRSRVVPGTYGSGFFGLFFAENEGGSMRVTIPFETPQTVLGSTITAEDGSFEFQWDNLSGGEVIIEASFAGNDLNWPSLDQTHIP